MTVFPSGRQKTVGRWRHAVWFLAILLGGTFASPEIGRGQTPDDGWSGKSAPKAAALSILLPGLGQRYVQDGSWKGTATLFALADIAAWTALFRTSAVRSDRVNAYRALAVSRAGAVVDGKDRTFFLNLATYRSSEEYLEVQLRNRAWDRIDYVSSPEFQWSWQSEADFSSFRSLREDSESLGRRRSILIATLAANRIVSALLAMRSAGRANRQAEPTVSFSPPPAGSSYPVVHVELRL